MHPKENENKEWDGLNKVNESRDRHTVEERFQLSRLQAQLSRQIICFYMWAAGFLCCAQITSINNSGAQTEPL